MTYTVNFYASHPNKQNDDCWMGEDYETLEQARAAFETDPMDLAFAWTNRDVDANPTEHRLNTLCSQAATVRETAFLELDGPDVNEVRPNPHFDARRAAREAAAHERECRREQAMQAGMMHGLDAYNDSL